MKYCNIIVNGARHLACDDGTGLRDLTAAGFPFSMEEMIGRGAEAEARALCKNALPVGEEAERTGIFEKAGKIICVGLNYRDHAQKAHMQTSATPALFSKYSDAFASDGEDVCLPPWETTYDYEAELVIVMGKPAWGISKEEARSHIFGFSCGNDVSCREAQKRTTQWLIGKTMPGFAPCGPCIVTADGFDPDSGKAIRSYVNGELRQNGTTADMIFPCDEIVSYASHYIRLEPGDLIFTGTPSGVALEGGKSWLVPGDRVEIEIEGIGKLTNCMKAG